MRPHVSSTLKSRTFERGTVCIVPASRSLTHIRASQGARVPARHGFPMPLSLEKVVPSNHLRIAAILNLVPTASRFFSLVRRIFRFRYNSFHIQLTDKLKELHPSFFNMVCILQSRLWRGSADH